MEFGISLRPRLESSLRESFMFRTVYIAYGLLRGGRVSLWDTDFQVVYREVRKKKTPEKEQLGMKETG